MLEKIKIYIGSGCRFGLYSNKQEISYQGQPKVIAKSNNSSSYIKQNITQSWHLVVMESKLSSAKDISFICSINSFLQLGLYFSSTLGELKLTLVIILC